MSGDIGLFYDKVSAYGDLSDGQKIDCFVYYLTEELGGDDAPTARIRQCFVDCDLPIPNRLAQYLSEGTKKKPGKRLKFIKTNNGYRLERHYKDDVASLIPDVVSVAPSNAIVPIEWFQGKRAYLETLSAQINISYDYGVYDGCAVLMRRLMETLIIEVFIQNKKADDIKVNGNFVPLEKLLSTALSEKDFHWNRNSKRDMEAVKKLGDTAAHDRTYITHKSDIEDLIARFRRLIQELASLSKLV